MDQVLQITLGDVLVLLGGQITIAAVVLAWIIAEQRRAARQIGEEASQLWQAMAAEQRRAAETYVTHAELQAMESRLAEQARERERRIRGDVDRLYEQLGLIRHRCGAGSPLGGGADLGDR